MNISIKARIYLSFLLLGSLFVLNGIFSSITLYQNKQQAGYISKVVDPSLQELNNFYDILIRSKMYTTNWVFLRSSQSDKDSLLKIHNTDYNDLKTRLLRLSKYWKTSASKDSLQVIFTKFEDLIAVEKKITGSLQKFEDYNDPVIKLQAEMIVEDEVIPRTTKITSTLQDVISRGYEIKAQEEQRLQRSSEKLRTFILLLAISIICAGFILSRYLTSIILKPIKKIRGIVNDLGRGVTNKIEHQFQQDEIGKMVHAVNNLSEKLRYTADFAQQIGQRNFNAPFQPLSDDDTLGKALVTMRDDLQSIDASLNQAQHIAHLGSWEWNMKNGKIFWSDEMYFIFGAQASSFTPKYESVLAFIHPKDLDKVNLHVQECIDNHQPFSEECRIISADKKIKVVFIQANVYLDEDGEVDKMYGIVQDITERKKAEAVLEQRNYALQQKNKELEQFAYVTSHDLQEPLRTISSFVERFQQQYKDRLDETAQKYLYFILQGSDRMKTLIKDLLDYSRIGRKKELTKIDCNEVLRNVLADLNTAVQESQAMILARPLPSITGYATEIKQLFQNLIINAVKFRKKDAAPVITISSRRIDNGWEFSVQDNGIGIEEEHNERIFVIFQRLHTRSEYEGSGIGLSHCKKITELHGGKIWVKSKPGEGSTFYFTILENHNYEEQIKLRLAY